MRILYGSLGAVVLAAAAFAGGVYWGQTNIDAAPNGVSGRVVARDASSLTLQLSAGGQKTFFIGPQTSFAEMPPALAKTPADATIGMLVKVFATAGAAANSVLLLQYAGTTTPPGAL